MLTPAGKKYDYTETQDFDSDAVSSLARPNQKRYEHARSPFEAVRRLEGEAIIPAVVLVELI